MLARSAVFLSGLRRSASAGSGPWSATMTTMASDGRVKSRHISPRKLRGNVVDESQNSASNVGSLKTATATALPFGTLFPDENTAEALFNGVPFKDLPVVTICCHKNNTRIWVHTATGEPLVYQTPKMCGFLNASKRTSVAAQAAGLAAGQKLRLLNFKTVRVRISGFNNGRISSVNGITQAGITIVCVSDVTLIDWAWLRRPKKQRRVN